MNLDLSLEAAQRWREIRPRQKGMAAGWTLPVDTMFESLERTSDEQPRLRSQHLKQLAAETTAKALAGAAEASPSSIRTQDSVIEALGRERIIGSNDLRDINFLELGISMARAVGRITIGNEMGTGLLVGPSLLITNFHVLGSDQGAAHAMVRFDYQENNRGELLQFQDFRFIPDSFFVGDRELDFTIVGVESVSRKGRPLSGYPWVKLIADLGKAEDGDPLNIIEHPRGGFKQIAFRNNTIITIPRGRKDFLYYTTDTEPGSSGSPCFNDQWELVALHHSGVPETNDQGQPLKLDGTPWVQNVDSPALIHWVANEGVRISAIVNYLKAERIKSEWQDRLEQMFTLPQPNPIELARSGSGTQTVVSSQPIVSKCGNMGTSFSWNIPLQVTVTVGPVAGGQEGARVGDPTILMPVSVPKDEPTGGEEKVVIDLDWNARNGFDPNFLDLEVPLPKINPVMLKDAARVLPEFRKHGNDHELAYYNFSVVINKRRRTAWFSAANIDGDHRFDLGKREGDRWFQDKRISLGDQLDQSAFESGIDRGHITRRQDVAWGETKEDATKATNDTFHFTNCSLQVSQFNRSRDRWQGLEQFLLEKKAQAEKRKLVVISGPVFAPNDPIYQNDKMDYSVRCPLQFWKVCVLIRQNGTPSATAFILGQEEISNLPGFEERLDIEAAQLSIIDLEEKTGLDFGNLKLHDHFAAGGVLGTLEVSTTGRRIKPLRSYEDIIV
jgi:endonuclease G